MSLDQLVTVAPMCWLSSSLGNDCILSILSPPCSFQTGLHSASLPTEEGPWWGSVSRLGGTGEGRSCFGPHCLER